MRGSDGMEFYTIQEVARILCVCDETVRRYTSTGVLRAFKLKTSWRIKKKDLERFIKDRSNVDRLRKQA